MKNNTIEFHPIANLFPMMEGEPFNGLVEDIRNNGLIDPIWLYDEKILDGRNRYMACLAAKVEPSFRTFQGDGMDALKFVLSVNLQRRQLDKSQRACVAQDVLPMYEKYAKERQKRKPKDFVMEKVPEQNGNSRDFVAYEFDVNSHYIQDAKLVKTEAPGLFEEVKAGIVNLKEAINHIKKEKKEKAKAKLIERAQAEPVKEYNCFSDNNVYASDIIDIDFPENSVDMIFTDPPYHDEYLDCFIKLAIFADKVLKPGAYLMTYCGKMFLPEVMKSLGEKLEYVWEFGVYQPDNNSKIMKHHLFEAWRPILCYKKPGKTITREWQPDMIKGTRDKSFHEWQQQIEPPLKYIDAYTLPGELVVDPFCGGGTTLVACKKITRRYLGFDKDILAVQATKERLNETHI